jgi:hypothetical protein
MLRWWVIIMAADPRGQPRPARPPRLLVTGFRWFASLKLAVLLITILAAVLAVATLVETSRGREYAQWYVYHSPWFAALLGLLSANILAAAVIRYPWGLKRLGFLVTHAGLLALLAGSIQTFLNGIEGILPLEEGEAASMIRLPDRSQFTAMWQGRRGAQGQMASTFVFSPGPVDWPEGKTLDLGYLGGVGIKVLRFYRHARSQEAWVPGEAGAGTPALSFALQGPGGHALQPTWLAADAFGGHVQLGPSQLEFLRAPCNSMTADFLDPSPAGSDKEGVLSVHYQDRMERVPVSKNRGKKIPVGQSGISVEIVEYLPNAKPTSGGRFASEGTQPLNPLLELRVQVPGKDKPVRQIAFANLPLLGLDRIHGWECPVKFWYHHGALAAKSGAEFLQTPDGKLHCRVGRNGKYASRGVVKEGDEIELSPQFKIVLLKHLPDARQEVTFAPEAVEPGENGEGEPAALVEVDAEGTLRQLWMRRNDDEHGFHRIETPEGQLLLAFGFDRLPLEFSLKLVRFEHGLNPGRMGDASFASTVRLVDRAARINEDREISMNEPLVHGKFVFYQSSYRDLPTGKSVSILSVAYDPGRLLKYSGCVLICLGTFIMFYMRAPWMKSNRPRRD